MTRCRVEIQTYHLPDNERMRYVLSHDCELHTIFNNYVILFVGPEAFGTYIVVLLSQEPKGI